ncbi:MAG: hypothetical protein CSB55_02260 [Candidatus Cloacimonadota bacterium]|nr:MAG: hypothetical protein CSB55_02260 [Candidatus Cloacimonadota bacterium]
MFRLTLPVQAIKNKMRIFIKPNGDSDIKALFFHEFKEDTEYVIQQEINKELKKEFYDSLSLRSKNINAVISETDNLTSDCKVIFSDEEIPTVEEDCILSGNRYNLVISKSGDFAKLSKLITENPFAFTEKEDLAEQTVFSGTGNKPGEQFNFPVIESTCLYADFKPQYKFVFSNGSSEDLTAFLLLNQTYRSKLSFSGEKLIFTDYKIAYLKEEDRKINVRRLLKTAESFCGNKFEAREPVYRFFARNYDDYMSHVEYDKWIKFVLERYNKEKSCSPKHILELACGTGNIAVELARKGLNVHASDNSPEMLDIAFAKPTKPRLYLEDMTAPLPCETYDLILLLFDSINYLDDDAKIKKVMSRVKEGLKKDGIFIFDISTKNNCRENFDGFVNIEDHDDFYFVHTGELSESQMFQISQLVFFKESPTGLIREEESHIQVILPVAAFKEFTESSGLELTGIYSMETENNLLKIKPETLDNKFGRLFFVCRKK